MDVAVENYISTKENLLLDEEEVQFSQFKRLGKIYLPNKEYEGDNETWLKRGNIFYHLVKDKKFNEMFIVLDKAPYFWIYDSPFNKYLKNYFRLNPTVKNESNSMLEFMEFYSRWVLGKSQEEKTFYANSAVDVIKKRKFNKHFIGQILESVIYIFNPSLNQEEQSADLLKQASEKIFSFKFPHEIQVELDYYINLFSGFAYLKQNSLEMAADSFNNALVRKHGGINAKFYLAFINAKIGNEIVANNILHELYDYDLSAVASAMDENNNFLYNAYCHENVVQNVFRYKEFLSVIDLLSSEIGIRNGNSDFFYSALKVKLIDFGNIDFTTKLDKENLQEIFFVEKALSYFSQKNNLIFLSSLHLLENKFFKAVSSMMTIIAAKYEAEIQQKLLVHDAQIEETRISLDKLKDEIGNTVSNLKVKHEKRIEIFKDSTKRTIEAMEDKIANLANRSEYNVFTVFKNNMFYNLFFALIVVLIVGFASYSNNFVNELSNLQKIFSSFILTGAPWGIVSFIIGAIFSLIHMLSVISDRNNKKVVLLKKIENFKNSREQELNRLNKELLIAEKTLIRRLEEKAEFTQSRIENLLGERKAQEEIIRQSYKGDIEKETIPLREFLLK